MVKKQTPKPHRHRWQQKQRRQKGKEFQRMESESPCKELPVDVLHEILVRYPVKALCKFRCVCKQWCSLISHPSFLRDHYRRSQQNPLLLMMRCEFNNPSSRNSKTNTLHLSVYNNEGARVSNFSKTGLQPCLYEPIQSCLGLVCLGARYNESPILVCNPSTQELITSPPVFGKHHCIGFGYAAVSKEFKVVRFFLLPPEDPEREIQQREVSCEIYVLGTNKWRAARSPPPQCPPTFYTWGAPFLHGALHLVRTSHYSNKQPCIDVFDVETEKYTKIPFPEYYHTLRRSIRGLVYFTGLGRLFLKELQGSLCLTFHLTTRVEFWCLKDYHNREWVKEYSVDLSSLGLEPYVWLDPLQIIGDGTMMLNTKTKGITSLWYYNFENKSFSEDRKENTSGTLYNESFFPLCRNQTLRSICEMDYNSVY